MSVAEQITRNVKLNHIERWDAMQQLGGLPIPLFSLIFEGSSL